MTVDAPTPTAPTDDETDQAFLDLVERLRPVFGEVIKVAIEGAIDAVPTPIKRPAQVTAVNAATGVVTVVVDGDTSAVTAQVIGELPGVGDRVIVEFTPPATAFVVGIVGGGGVPSGSLLGMLRPISSDGLGQDGAGTAPPRGYLWCHGQVVDAAQYPVLYAVLGTRFNTGGEGTNPVQFRVPDLRGRFLLGLDNMGGTAAGRVAAATTLGVTGGAATHTLATANLPSHNHDGSGFTVSFTQTPHTHTIDASKITLNAGVATGVDWNVPASWTAATLTGSSNASLTASITGNTGNTGSGTAVDHLPPYLAIHWCIKT